MHSLKTLINKHLQQQRLSRSQLVRMLGYTNINSGIRVLDKFIDSPSNRPLSDFASNIQTVLKIPAEDFNKAIAARYAHVNKESIARFKPSIRVTWSRKPNLLMTAQPYKHLYEINLPDSILTQAIKEQVPQVIAIYQRHQLQYFGEQFQVANALQNYSELVGKIEQQLAQGEDISWAVGAGFCYRKSFNENFYFDRKCEKIAATTN